MTNYGSFVNSFRLPEHPFSRDLSGLLFGNTTQKTTVMQNLTQCDSLTLVSKSRITLNASPKSSDLDFNETLCDCILRDRYQGNIAQINSHTHAWSYH